MGTYVVFNDLVLPGTILYGAGIVLLVLAVISYLGYSYYMRMKKFSRAVTVEEECKKNGHPMVEVWDAGGVRDTYVGEKNDDVDPSFKKHRGLAIHIDPKLFGKSPQNITNNGVQILTYFFNFHFPVDKRGNFALTTLLKMVRTEYDILNFIQDDPTLISLIFTDNKDLVHDCDALLTIYEKEGIDAEELADIVNEIQKKIKRDKIPSGYFNVADGLKLLPIAESAQDLLRLMQLAEFKGAKDITDNKVDKQWTYIYMAIALLGAIVLGMYFLVKYV